MADPPPLAGKGTGISGLGAVSEALISGAVGAVRPLPVLAHEESGSPSKAGNFGTEALSLIARAGVGTASRRARLDAPPGSEAAGTSPLR